MHSGTELSHFPEMTVDAIGYGAGSHNLSGRPNVLRICVGEVDELTEALKYNPATVGPANLGIASKTSHA